MTTDITAHIAEVREKLWPWKPLNPRYAARGLWEVQDANGFERHLMVFGGQEKAEAVVDALLALPQTLDLLEAEHERAERLVGALLTFGSHGPACAITKAATRFYDDSDYASCTCGFVAALEAQETKP